MPNLRPPVTTTAMAQAYRDRIAGRAARRRALRAAADALPYRQHERGGDRRGQVFRVRARGEVLPGWRDDAIGCRRHRDRAGVSGVRGDAGARARAVAARRGHGCRRRRVRSRARVRRPPSDAHRPRFPGAEDRAGARDDARGGGVRRRGAGERRGDDHAAASPVVAQCALRRRVAAAFLLHADPEARSASRSAGARRDVRAARNSSSAPIRRRMRATRRKAPAAAPDAIRRRWRFRYMRRRSRMPAHSTGSKASRAISARTSTGCRAMPTRSRWCARPGRCPAEYAFGNDALVPLRAGETMRWQVES